MRFSKLYLSPLLRMLLWFAAAGVVSAEPVADTQVLWRQFGDALRIGDYVKAREFRVQLPEATQKKALLWARLQQYPHNIISANLKPTPYGKDIIASTIARLSEKNVLLAQKLWRKFSADSTFNAKQQVWVAKAFARQLAYTNSPQAEQWFRQIPQEQMTPSLLEWRLRNRIGQQDWYGVLNLVEQLPTQTRQHPCWQYWYARALLQVGQTREGLQRLGHLATERHYYGFLASLHLEVPAPLRDQRLSTRHTAGLEVMLHPKLQEAKLLFQTDKVLAARNVWRSFITELDDDQRYMAAVYAQSWGWYDEAIFTVRGIAHQDDLSLRFPVIYQKDLASIAKKTQLPLPLLFAIVRQESAFQADATSPQGAVGLMQIMPATAKSFSRRSGWDKTRHEDLHITDNNLMVGCHYYNYLVSQFDGDYLQAAAAYNAGIGRVKRWQNGNTISDPIIWVETLPWRETRNYVKNILSYFAIYQYRLGHDIDLQVLLDGRGF